MQKAKSTQHSEILQYALSHLEKEREQIQAKIDSIREQLGGRKTSPSRTPALPTAVASDTPRRTRVLSDAARKRIAAAQKRRWAEHRRNKKAE